MQIAGFSLLPRKVFYLKERVKKKNLLFLHKDYERIIKNYSMFDINLRSQFATSNEKNM